MKKIKIYNPDNLKTIDYHNLEPFQDDLKTITDEEIDKLCLSIIENGFIVPKFVWKNDDKFYLMDGHQTVKALEQLENGWEDKARGYEYKKYEIPEIPIVKVDAENEKDAAEKLLQINSRYGQFNLNTDFFELKDIKIEKLNDLNIPELEPLKFMNDEGDYFEIDDDIEPERDESDDAVDKDTQIGNVDQWITWNTVMRLEDKQFVNAILNLTIESNDHFDKRFEALLFILLEYSKKNKSLYGDVINSYKKEETDNANF